LPLSTCSCGWAEDKRAEIRARMEQGDELSAIQDDYRKEYGAKALSIPADEGLDRALWAVPVLAILLAAGGVVFVGRRWRRQGAASGAAAAAKADTPVADRGAYDKRLEEELAALEDP